MVRDRYEAVGLRGNPFAFEAIQSSAAVTFVDRSLDLPPGPGSRAFVQVLGAKGAGKTTQLHAWRRTSPGPYHYVPRTPYRSRWARPPVEALVYGDEIDRMPRALRRWWLGELAKLDATVVVGSHIDLEAHARRAGFAVVTWALGAVDLETLRSVVLNRVAHARIEIEGRPDAESFLINEDDLLEIHAACGGSIRAAESLLHAYVASRVAD